MKKFFINSLAALLVGSVSVLAADKESITEKALITGAAIDAANDWFVVGDESVTGNNPSLRRMKFTEAANVAGFFSAVPNGTFALSKLSQSSATPGQAAIWNGTAWAPATVSTNRAGEYRLYDYGARADGVYLYDGTYTSGSTAFTSASASFTSADVGKKIVLQLSQGTRQILTISSVTNATTIVMSAAASANSSAYTYRITCYGTDNSAAIQSAIDASGGYGTILGDKGTYLCTAAASGFRNSIFALPYSTTAAGASPSITFRGVATPNFAHFNGGQRPSQGGTIIYCPNETVSGVEPSVFAVVPYDWDPGVVPNSVSYWGSTATMLSMEDITFQQVPATKLHTIQQHLGGAMYINRCAFVTDTPYSKDDNLLLDPQTGGAASAAIIPPSKLSAYWSKIENSYIYGRATGIRFTDNVRLDQVVFEFCDKAMEGTLPLYTNGMSAGALYVWRCRVVLAGHINATIQQINYENVGLGGFTPSWSVNNTGADIDNYLGHIRGDIGIFVVQGGVGARPAIVRVAETVTPATANTLVVRDLVSGKVLGNNIAESLRITPVTASPAAPTLATAGTAGSTTYKYRIAYNLPDGSVIVGAEATITTGNATLSSTNKITFPNIPFVSGSCSLKLYRTAGPATLGLISSWFDPSTNGSNFVQDVGATGDGVVPITTAGRLWFTNNSGTWDGANITGAQAFTSSSRPTSAGTGTPNATDLVTRADADTRYGQRIYHQLDADLTNNAGGTSVSGTTVTIPVGKWIFRGTTFLTRNAIGYAAIGNFKKVSGGSATARSSILAHHDANFNSAPYIFSTAGSAGQAFNSDTLMNSVMDSIAGGCKTSMAHFEGWINVTGSPLVMRFEVTQGTLDAANPAILKAGENWVEFVSTN